MPGRARILDRLADEIVAMVTSAARRLRMTRSDPDVVLGGGVMQAGDRALPVRVEDGVHAQLPRASVRVARQAARARRRLPGA